MAGAAFPSASLSTVTAKGQVTLRRALLDHIGVRPGEQIEIVPTPEGQLTVRPVRRGSIEDFFGSIEHDGTPALTIKEMNEVIRKGWAGELVSDD